MKIMIIHPKWYSYRNNHFAGGSEKVCHTHIKVLSKKHEVILLTDKNSEVCNIEGVKTVFIDIENQNNYSGSVSRYSRKRKDFIRNCIYNLQPDCIMGHDITFPLCFEIDIPYFHFYHSSLAASGGIQKFGIIDFFKKAVMNNHKIVFVSESQKKEFYKFENRYHNEFKFEETSFVSEVCYNQCIDHLPSISENVYYDLCMIARCDEIKKIHMVAKQYPSLHWFTNSQSIKSNPKYFEKVKKYLDPKNIFIDLEHQELMKTISTYKALCVNSEESSSLVAIEANGMGVPVFIMSDKTGAVKEMCSLSGFENSYFDIYEQIKPIDRYKLSSKTREYFSEKRLLNTLDSIITNL